MPAFVPPGIGAVFPAWFNPEGFWRDIRFEAHRQGVPTTLVRPGMEHSEQRDIYRQVREDYVIHALLGTNADPNAGGVPWPPPGPLTEQQVIEGIIDWWQRGPNAARWQNAMWSSRDVERFDWLLNGSYPEHRRIRDDEWFGRHLQRFKR